MIQRGKQGNTSMTQTKPYTIGAIQMRMSEKPDDNVGKALDLLRQAARKGVQVACLPELFRSFYFCQTEDHDKYDLAESIPGATSDALCAVAKETGMAIIGSLFERRAAGVYHNTAIIIDADGQMLGLYRKMHIPDDPLYYEKFYFTPGDLGFKAWDTAFGKIGTLVCWDQWYPEGARLTALQGAEVLFYPTAIGWHPSEKAQYGEKQADAWETVQRGHAIANGCYVAGVNRIGHETEKGNEGIEFFGRSFICGPSGEILAKAGSENEEILTATVDPRALERHRQHWPFLRDRRIDYYGGITKRFGNE